MVCMIVFNISVQIVSLAKILDTEAEVTCSFEDDNF